MDKEQAKKTTPAQTLDRTIAIPKTKSDAGNSKTVQEFSIGDVIKDRFVLTEHLGRGGMGNVYKALDLIQKEAKEQNPWVAIKLLNVLDLNVQDALICLQRETRKARDLAHPNIIRVYDVDRDKSSVFMTMEYVQGTSLDQWIIDNAPASLEKCFPIWQAIASALNFSHQRGTVHCDFKPSNVIISEQGDIKVIDFGIARAKADVAHQGAHHFDVSQLGAYTPAYASCDLIAGDDPEAKDDIFAFAIVMYEMLTGKHPYPGKTAKLARALKLVIEPVPSIPTSLWQNIEQGLKFKKDERIGNAYALINYGEKEHKTHTQKLVFIALAAIVLFYVLTVAFTGISEQEDKQQLAAPVAIETTLTAEQQEEIELMLTIAEAHFDVERYILPVGANAREAFNQVLAIDVNNQRALLGLKRIADYYVAQAREFLHNKDVERAAMAIAQGLETDPNHPELISLQQQIESF